MKEENLITNIHYDDEVLSLLKDRLKIQSDKKLPVVGYRKYSKVRNWTVGLSGGKDKIAILRVSGSISHAGSPLSISSSGIVEEKFIEKIRKIRESKKFKAVVLRIDSPGGDALASDLMWREITLLAAKIPVVASMSDVAASGGYYMAMGTSAIVAENLTLTGSIGVFSAKFNLGKLYEKIGFNKEIISRGKFAELNKADQRPLRPDEEALFTKTVHNIYQQFRDKAAASRSMPVDKMEEVAQGRVWTGADAASCGLVDAIGGISRAIAIAKQKANIPQDQKVKLVELSRPSLNLLELFFGIGASLFGVDMTMKGPLEDTSLSDVVQARMEDIVFQTLGDASSTSNPVLHLIQDYLSYIDSAKCMNSS